jgi:thiamine kinase-like enzyme
MPTPFDNFFAENTPESAQVRCTKEIFKHFSMHELLTASNVAKKWKRFVDAQFQQKINEDRVIAIAPFFTRHDNHAIADVSQLPGGLTNKTFRVKTLSRHYVARQPGAESSAFINRNAESYNARIAGELGVAPSIYFTNDAGAMISRFIDNSQTMSPVLLNESVNLQHAVTALKKIHSSNKRFANDCNVFERNRVMRDILKKNQMKLPESFHEIEPLINRIEAIIAKYSLQTAPCHNDTTPGNFLLSNDSMWIIDWEYSANNDPLWDLVNLSMEAGFSDEQDAQMLQAYYGDVLSDQIVERYKLYKPVVEYWVVLWCMVQISNKNYDSLTTLEELEQKRMNMCLQILQDEKFMEILTAAEEKIANQDRGIPRRC